MAESSKNMQCIQYYCIIYSMADLWRATIGQYSHAKKKHTKRAPRITEKKVQTE